MYTSKTLNKAKKYINKILVPLEQHYYHSYVHAIEVMERSLYLWKKEWLNEDELEIIWLAWLFHDTWFIIQYDNNEPIWAKIANNYLRSIIYPEDKIKIIENIIIATDPNKKITNNIYEKIVKDADLDNLWREDFFDKWNSLKKEIELIKDIKIKDPEWVHGSVTLLKEHQYETLTQRLERDNIKEKNLKKMLDELENEKI